MIGFLVFTGIVAIIVIFFRYWRKREVRAFLETDMSALEQMNLAGDERISQPAIASIPPADCTQKETLASTFHLKEEIFDDVHRGCLKALDEVIDERQRLFVHVPLKGLIHSDEKADRDRLNGVTLPMRTTWSSLELQEALKDVLEHRES